MKKLIVPKAQSFGRVVVAAAALAFAGGAYAETPAPPPPAAPAPGAPSGPDHGAMGHDMKGMGGMGGMGGMMGGGMGGGMDMKGMDHGGGGMDMKGMDHGGGGGGMMRKMACGVSENVEPRLAYLKAELHLTDAQQAAWNAFAEAYRAATQKVAQKCAANSAKMPDHAMHGVLGQLTMMEQHMGDHLETVRALKAAIEPLFTALTDEQKKVADHTMSTLMEVGMPRMMGMGQIGRASCRERV
jgi:hypothetical protein